MKKSLPISYLFLDIGGVLLSNGWDHHARKRAAATFKLDWAATEARHRLTFEVYEEGRLTLEEYLRLVIFHEKRSFSIAAFRKFMFAQSRPHAEMIALGARLKDRHKLKIVVVSNEGRELNAHRVRTFKLDHFVDAFISSSAVHIRKPDVAIFRLALDVAHASASSVLYVEDTPMFVEVAKGLAMQTILHTDYRSTCAALTSYGLDAA